MKNVLMSFLPIFPFVYNEIRDKGILRIDTTKKKSVQKRAIFDR